jgi:hypothetical protein
MEFGILIDLGFNFLFFVLTPDPIVELCVLNFMRDCFIPYQSSNLISFLRATGESEQPGKKLVSIWTTLW